MGSRKKVIFLVARPSRPPPLGLASRSLHFSVIVKSKIKLPTTILSKLAHDTICTDLQPQDGFHDL